MTDFRISMAAARKNARMTQTDVAATMHVSRQTIINWENGRVYPKPAQFKMFCDVCGVPVDHVFLPEVEL